MRKLLPVLFLVVCMLCSGCGGSANTDVDLDLSVMSDTVVYAELQNIYMDPQSYLGKTIRIKGTNSIYSDNTGIFYSVMVLDATACCSQGIEYQLSDITKYQADGNEVCVSGEFGMYELNGMYYCTLKNATYDPAKN